MKPRLPGLGIAGIFAAMVCNAAVGQEAKNPAEVDFHITAPTMVAALIQFSEQSRIQLVFPTEGAAEIAAPHVVGMLTPRDALERLLRGSGLRYEFVNGKTVSVSLQKTASASAR